MGLTVHYAIETTTKSRKRAVELLGNMRQFALDFAFEEVGDVAEYNLAEGDTIPEHHSWLGIQADTSVDIPWSGKRGQNGHSSMRVSPEWLAGFTCWPGPGCESLEIVLSQHPSHVEVQYKPEDDARFRWKPKKDEEPDKDWFWGGFKMDWQKFNRWCKRNNRTDLDVNHGKVNQSGQPFPPLYSPARLYEQRKIRVPYARRLNCSAFCKTQYASEFGMAHFVRCHLSVCHLLRKIGTLPGVTVEINDEGHYETSVYSDNWNDPEVETTYVPHDATYSVPELVKQCQEYNEHVAAMVGVMSDFWKGQGLDDVAPIKQFGNFEHLEAKGADSDHMQKFIAALKEAAKPQVEAALAASGE